MKVIGTLLRVLGYIFHTLLTLALLAVGLVDMLSDGAKLRIEMLPWQGDALARWMVGLGLLGLVSVVLAMLGRLRGLYILWCLFVLVMWVRGVFFASGVTFADAGQFQMNLWAILVALLAFLGSLTRPWKPLR
jgi:hypothetical protein